MENCRALHLHTCTNAALSLILLLDRNEGANSVTRGGKNPMRRASER